MGWFELLVGQRPPVKCTWPSTRTRQPPTHAMLPAAPAHAASSLHAAAADDDDDDGGGGCCCCCCCLVARPRRKGARARATSRAAKKTSGSTCL